MKRLFYGDQLSPHRIVDTNGQLICLDVPIARTGKQQYLAKEIGVDDEEPNTLIDVDRPYDEVFSKETLASFENAPVTLEHPKKDVKVGDNYKQLAVGFTKNVRQGKLKDYDVILADLVIYDEDVKKKIIDNEINEVSCGYDCNITDSESGYCQTCIRGNHVAIVEAGRAGIAKIADSQVEDMAKMSPTLVNAINSTKREIKKYADNPAYGGAFNWGGIDGFWYTAQRKYYLREDEREDFEKSIRKFVGEKTWNELLTGKRQESHAKEMKSKIKSIGNIYDVPESAWKELFKIVNNLMMDKMDLRLAEIDEDDSNEAKKLRNQIQKNSKRYDEILNKYQYFKKTKRNENKMPENANKMSKDFDAMDVIEARSIYNSKKNSFEESIKDSAIQDADEEEYFGKDQYEKYGAKVKKALKGRTLSRSNGELDKVAKELGMSYRDLIATIEGLAHNGQAKETSDGTYKIGDTKFLVKYKDKKYIVKATDAKSAVLKVLDDEGNSLIQEFDDLYDKGDEAKMSELNKLIKKSKSISLTARQADYIKYIIKEIKYNINN